MILGSGQASGKVILSGEHAVVYGRPAIAFTVPLTTRVRITAGHETAEPAGDRYRLRMSPESLTRARKRHEIHRYANLPAGEILQSAQDLVDCVVCLWREARGGQSELGGMLEVESDIPRGAGMGSSAALIVAILRALESFAGPMLDPIALYRAAREAEDFLHGRSSGLDVYTVLHEGAWFFDRPPGLDPEGCASACPLPAWPAALVLTGTPQSSTAACVNMVREIFEDHEETWRNFERITRELREALAQRDNAEFLQGIIANHQALRGLSVVPDPVQTWMEGIIRRGWAGKLCGAGSHVGPFGGLALLCPPLEERDTWEPVLHYHLAGSPYTLLRVMNLCEAS